ncbi:MAG: amidohydrolase family protein [Armatimonadota bacterium]
MGLRYFDAYVCIGPRRAKHPAHAWSLPHVWEEMRHCSISGALVCHQLSINYDPMHGNLLLSRELEPYPHLFPMWNVIPHHTGEFPEPTKLLSLMQQHGVHAVTLNPATNGWDMYSELNRPLIAALERAHIFTIIRRDQVSSYQQLEAFLEKYPALPVMLTHVHWDQQRYITPLLLEYPNLHLTFNHYQAHYGVEFLVEQGLGDRLLYSSNAPEMSMGAHRAYLDYAEISEPIKEMIAGGNLACLLKGQEPAEEVINPDEDSLMRNARQGQPQEVPLLDMHIHMLHEGMHGAGGSYAMRDGGPSGTLQLMQRLGYDGAGVMSWSVVSGDAAGGNEVTRAALDAFPETYWGLGSFDPTHYSQEEMRRQIEEIFADERFLGVKPYPVFGLRYDDPLYDLLWEYANARHLYALIHRTTNDFSEIDILASRYPDITWVVAHCGSDYKTADQTIACVKNHPNVYAEITLTPVPLGIIDYLANGAGADRILYGSDLPMRDPRQQLGWVIFSRLSEEDKKKILGGNAQRILEKCRAGRIPERTSTGSQHCLEGR